MRELADLLDAQLELVAAGQESAELPGMDPHRAARYLAGEMNSDELQQLVGKPGGRYRPVSESYALPWYMPFGAPRPMSLRETVQELNRLNARVAPFLVLLMLGVSMRELCPSSEQGAPRFGDLSVPPRALCRAEICACPQTGPPPRPGAREQALGQGGP